MVVPAASPTSRVHIAALDGVRGIAVLLVLAHNFNLIEGARSLLARATGLALNSGWLGVQLFFALSGFLITGILLDTRGADNYWSAFLARRALRIFPLYYAVLITAFVLARVAGYSLQGSEHQVWLWTYLANFAPSVNGFSHFWSLSVEEQFYLVWPLLVRNLSRGRLAKVCAALIVVAIASRVVLRSSSFGPEAAYTFTMARVDALSLGALAAIGYREAHVRAWLIEQRGRLRWGSFIIALATLVSTRGAARTGVHMQTYGYTVFGVVFTYYVLDAVLARPSDTLVKTLSSSPLRSLGRYSYAMYVFHLPLHLFVGLPLLDRLFGVRSTSSVAFALAYFLIATLATYVASLISYHVLERHWLALKRYAEPRVVPS